MEFPPSMFKLDLRLRFSDIDSANIAYFARYPSFFDESFIAAMLFAQNPLHPLVSK